jgi:hypothetical protein
MERVVFDRLLAYCRDEGLVAAGGRQRTDSTHVISAVRGPEPDRPGRGERAGGLGVPGGRGPGLAGRRDRCRRARRAVRAAYRHKTLSAARENAAKLSTPSQPIKGAKFAWESALTGKETAPDPWGTYEIHINSDIALAQ